MGRYDQTMTMAFLDNLAADGPIRPDIDLQRGHVPAGHVLDVGPHLPRIGQSPADKAMKGRVTIQKRTAQKHPWATLRVHPGKIGYTCFGHNLNTRVAYRSDAVAQEQGENLGAIQV